MKKFLRVFRNLISCTKKEIKKIGASIEAFISRHNKGEIICLVVICLFFLYFAAMTVINNTSPSTLLVVAIIAIFFLEMIRIIFGIKRD